MTNETKKVSGYILLSVPTIAYGGYFLLTLLSGQHDHLLLTDFQKAMFRAGHAHAGVLVLLALVAQLFMDHTSLSSFWRWISRIAFPVSALLISGGFFASATGNKLTHPNEMIIILYVGVATLVMALIILGIGLIRK